MNLNRQIATYIAEFVPNELRGPVLDILEQYCKDKRASVTFTGCQELAGHMDNISNIIDSYGVANIIESHGATNDRVTRSRH